MKKRKVALVYDWVDKWGGVERLLLVLHKMYPNAQLYTSFYNRKTATWAKDIRVKTSFMQDLPEFVKKNRVLSLPFFPFAFRSFDFSSYDTVISVTSSFAKFIQTKPSTDSTSSPQANHICILLTPTRFLWSHQKEYFPHVTIIRMMVTPMLFLLRWWDKKAAQSPDILFSISEHVQKRVKKYYERESEVLYPPFNYESWNKVKSKVKSQKSKVRVKIQNTFPLDIQNTSYYLVVSRLEPYKKIELVFRLFNQSKQPLIVVGSGTQEKKLKNMASENILVFKNLSEVELGYLYKHAQALIMPQNEDFGYISLEAQFFGCPVVSYKNSGAAETIINKKTGILFNQQSIKSLSNAIERLKYIPYNERHESDYLRGRSWHKTLATFKKKISQAVRKNSGRSLNSSAHRTKTHSRV